MKRAVGAVLSHCTKFDNKGTEFRPRCCPLFLTSKTTRCKWHKNNSESKAYSPKVNIPEWIYHTIIIMFQDLMKDGETQNANEALNQLIWLNCLQGNL